MIKLLQKLAEFLTKPPFFSAKIFLKIIALVPAIGQAMRTVGAALEEVHQGQKLLCRPGVDFMNQRRP
jgi:hypothetical protein